MSKFHLLEVVGRGSETRLQASANLDEGEGFILVKKGSVKNTL